MFTRVSVILSEANGSRVGTLAWGLSEMLAFPLTSAPTGVDLKVQHDTNAE